MGSKHANITTVQEKLAALPSARSARIKARAKELVAEETSLRQLREAHKKTQAKVALKLGIGQDSVLRLEQRTDMLLSTLREYVAAFGGSMRLVVEFKGKPDIELQNLGMLAQPKAKARVAVRKRTPHKRPASAA